MTNQGSATDPLRVVIAGGGVGALEVALALRALAPDRISTTLLTAETQFAYRPMSVLEPFSEGRARHYSVSTIADRAGAQIVADRLAAVRAPEHEIVTGSGATIGYDALVLAYGAIARDRFKHVRTIDDRRLDERLHGLIQDVADGYVSRIGFIAAAPMAWPLPLYELALKTARAAYDTSAEVSVTIVTSEPSPVAVFGDTASAAVTELLARNHVEILFASGCEVPSPGHLVVSPGPLTLEVDSIIALPTLAARQIPGVPDGSWLGLVPIDSRCRVVGLDDVWAVGDATDFPVKHGSIAAQQADAVAGQIAAHAGADVATGPFEPVLHGLLLGGERPLLLTARLAGERAITSEAVEVPAGAELADSGLMHPIAKIAARYLGPCLHELDLIAGTTV
jgi:sulfide:quinone oxidoreductase